MNLIYQKSKPLNAMTQTKLSESELQQIREEAAANATEKCIGYVEVGCSEIRQREINAYVVAAVKHITAERERAKEVVEALELLVRACRGEELKWNEIKWAETAINNYKNNK